MSPAQVEIRVLDGSNQEELTQELAQSLRAGQLAIVPTETVYGLVGLDRPDVIERLRAAKGERGDKPFARLVSGLRVAEADGAHVGAMARRLAARYWPGPLTLVLDVGSTTVGYRVPGHPLALRLAEILGEPLLATSANRSGDPPPVELGPAIQSLGEHVALAVDGGPAALKTPSTVVRLAAGQPAEILREGFLSHGSIARVSQRLVVFVCTGNTCRSPMAEALFRQKLAEQLGADPAAEGWEVLSAGVAAYPGGPPAAQGVQVMRERGLDTSGHLSRPLDAELMERAWKVVGLTPGHVRSITNAFPEHRDKVIVMDPRGVPDPVGASVAVYRECADHIGSRLDVLMEAELNVSTETQDLTSLFPAAGEVPADMDQAPYADGNLYLVGGEVRRWEGKTKPVFSCVCDRAADGTLTRRNLGEFAQLSGEVALQALDAAVQAWDLGRGLWPSMSLPERIKAIRAFVEASRAERETIVRLLMWEIGKPYKSACKEFDRTIEYIDRTLEALADLDRQGGTVISEGGVMAQVRRAPLGVTLCMGPFNYPLNEAYTTLIPALCMGNTVVMKLPKLGMLCNLPLLKHLAACFPPGVVNVIGGDGRELVSPIIQSGKVDVLAFIGSSKVASIIEKQHPAPYRLTTILGMDAKNPAIVLPDADLDLAVAQCVKGALSYNGQRCTALKILFVHEDIAEAFGQRVADAVEALTCGMPWTDDVQLTPLPEHGKVEWLNELLEDAKAKGAKVLNPNGGQSAGTFYAPAVLYPVSPEAQLYSVEQFGPLVPIVPFKDAAEVQRYVAESDYGQQVSVFGQDPKTLGPVLDALANQVCRINLNRYCSRGPDIYPFTGRKNSAEGTLSITGALETFSIESMVASGDPDGKPLFDAILEQKTSSFLRKSS